MMIKDIAFDLIGILVTEKDIDLTEEEDKLERMFGNILIVLNIYKKMLLK